jgi:hypothetical protein
MKNLKLFAALLFSASAFTFVACSNDDDNNPNDGKTDPSTIATSNLVAYFPFDTDGKESINSIAPKTATGVTYVAGRRNNAYQGADGAYLLYDLPTGNALRSLTAFSIAMWFYGPPAIDGVAPVPGIMQISGTTDPTWGNLMLTQDRMPDAVDSLNIKMVFHKEGAAWSNQFVGFSRPAFIENRWMHIVFAYDNTTSTYMVYVNGAPLTLKEDETKRWAAGDDVSPRPALGDLAFASATQFSIGGWMQRILGNSTDEWMGYFTGKIDELRIYNKGLSATEVKSLYDAEVTQLTTTE